ncbi:2548_t:CDS:2 [Dentiscutata erythropus]|uniref:2548_t:CDS:1 n=1 Tax=Dentiscutata erythropus TaxID=1348616 RepID=A0A9N9IA53_9GLOM|nr:2548_t:CDS:2 [Dentiscutata erythropus]
MWSTKIHKKKQVGHPFYFNSESLEKLNFILNNRFHLTKAKLCKEWKREEKQKMYPRTMFCALQIIGLKSYIALPVSLHTNRHIIERYNWCKEFGERLDPAYLVPVAKSKSQMIWGRFSWKGHGHLVAIHKWVNSQKYITILEKYRIPSFRNAIPKGKYFLPNGASSDLNPMENLWALRLKYQ